MLINCRKGQYKVETNFRDAFRLEAFEEKYIEECFDKYMYIVGDVSSGILRLKGFDTNPKSKNYFGFIEDYLEVSCAMGCPYYVLKRIKSDNEYQKELSKPSQVKTEGFIVNPLQKESFDKENLILETTLKTKPNVLIDSNKINAIPKGELTADLREIINQEQNTNKNVSNKIQEKQEPSQSYVSSSPGFVPNQNNNRFNRNNKKKK